jgi:hypothetical protein
MMPFKTKVIITQASEQLMTAQDINGIELNISMQHGLNSPLFVIFDENSPLQSLLTHTRYRDLLVIVGPWSEEIRAQLEQQLKLHDCIIVFANDYYSANNAVLADFDAYTIPKLSTVLEMSATTTESE